MRRAAAVAVLAAVVALPGCGGGGHARRDAVNAYFDRVETVQAPVRVHSVAISHAFASFSTARTPVSEIAALVRAHAILARVGARIAALRPPADATRMHRDIVRLYTLQAGVARELVQMVRFVPAYRRALTPVQPAHAALSRDLASARGWRAIGASFARYRTSLQGALAKLAPIRAPATLRPALVSERHSLHQSISVCVSIEAALARKDSKGTTRAINRLSGLSSQSSLAKARTAQVAATKAYNARLAAASALERKIGTERSKLVEALG